ncbi:hypothetical protein QFC19_000191 [Naganishia cerealis]|uniref:Uncharacterized protein n=1 Tax=Naganishia cerealis TaxID=610337 RepID=A0ACC2WNF3_9TREE|nr:hypothetical protein QFC19_000191 [Naganishia cerealis]
MATAELLLAIKTGNGYKGFSEEFYDSLVLGETYAQLKKYESVKFDPMVHLKFYSEDPIHKFNFNNTRRLTMEELGLTSKKQISHIGVLDPFPLFTTEAIEIMKQELLQKDLFLKYARLSYNSTSGTDCVVRGYAVDNGIVNTPFIHAAWTHPKTMELVSLMAGVELEIVFDYEIAHTNIAMTDEETALKEKESALARSVPQDVENIPAVVGWHRDSYPFVCVLMMSDTTNMVGGETALRMGDVTGNKFAVVPSPQSGHACVLQGGLIEHIAQKPAGMTERITMVTSYRPKDPLKYDSSNLKTVRPEINFGSIYNTFYPQWVKYRCQVAIKRLENVVENMTDEAGNFDKDSVTDLLSNVEEYVKDSYEEMKVSPLEWEKLRKKVGM